MGMGTEPASSGASGTAAIGGIPLVLYPDSGETATLLGFTVRLVYRDEPGTCALVELTVPPSSGRPPAHVHQHTEETFYVLAGALAVQVDETVLDAQPGTLVRVPPGAVHSFWTVGTETARILSTIVPAGVERFLLELGTRLASSDGSAEQARIIRRELASQYDVVYAAP
jgi:quercetin dioxygenase-like cupin family protein